MSVDAIRSALVAPSGMDAGDTSTAVVDVELAPWFDALSTGAAVFTRWRAHPAAKGGWGERAWGERDDLRLVGELRGAEFWRMAASHHRLAALASAADALRQCAESLRGKLIETWDTEAARAAATKVDKLASAARIWQDGLGQVAAGLDGARGVASDGLGKWVAGMGAPDQVAIDDRGLRIAQIDRVDAVLGGGTATPADLRLPGKVELNNPSDPWPATEVVNYLDDYCARYDAAVGRFRRDLRSLWEATERAWGALGDIVSKVDADPFAGFAGPARVEPPPSTAPQAASGDRVTIRDGDRTMVVTGPDQRGQYSLQVEQGGSVRTYGLDFSQGNRMELNDRGTKIVAERTADGVLRVGVDDGDGTPSTYTIDGRDEPAAPPAQPAPVQQQPNPAEQAGAGGGAGGGSGGGGGGEAGGGGGGYGGGGGGGGGGGAPTDATPVAEGLSSGAQQPAGESRPAPGGGGAAAAASGGGQQGGMPMGGMGGMGGAGQGQGGDQERKPSRWRLQGSLFEDADPASTFGGVVGEDPANRAKG